MRDPKRGDIVDGKLLKTITKVGPRVVYLTGGSTWPRNMLSLRRVVPQGNLRNEYAEWETK